MDILHYMLKCITNEKRLTNNLKIQESGWNILSIHCKSTPRTECIINIINKCTVMIYSHSVPRDDLY